MSVPPAVIKKTQDTLGKHVKKPPLTEKLLNKPPFRFLHDVISAVNRDSGAFDGLFADNELKSENVKDKESKIKYLEKVIDCVSFTLGDPVAAKPSKIVSGQEPQKTNEFLQAIAQIIEKKLDTGPNVTKVLNGEKPGKSLKNVYSNNNKTNAKNATNNAKNVDKKREGSNSRKNSLTGSNSSREPSKSRGNSKSPAKRISRQNSKEETSPKQNGGDLLSNGVDTTPKSLEPVIERPSENGTSHEHQPNAAVVSAPLTNGNHAHENNQPDSLHSSGSTPKTPPTHKIEESSEEVKETTTSKRPVSSGRSRSGSSRPITGYGKSRTSTSDENEPTELKNQEQKPEEKSRPGSAVKSARPRTGRLKSAARPPSARRPAPRLKEKNEVLEDDAVQQRPQTGKVANVIVDDGNHDNDDDADEFLVEEKPKDNLDLDTENTTFDANNMRLENGEHGALVQQILDTKKELEDGATTTKKGVEIEKDAGFSDFNRQREREAAQRDVSKLKDSIQTLTRSANPLGKLMDFLQEDVDSMQRELETWREENRNLQAQLRAEEMLTQQSIEPLKNHLVDLEKAVQEQLDMISTVKSNILKNDEKISRMVGSIGIAGK